MMALIEENAWLYFWTPVAPKQETRGSLRAEYSSVGVGTGMGPERIADAVNMALRMMGGMKGAKKVVLNVTGGKDIGIGEVQEIAGSILEFCDEEAFFVWGHKYAPEMKDSVRVAIIAGGLA
jgi:cell division protein FtsZ